MCESSSEYRYVWIADGCVRIDAWCGVLTSERKNADAWNMGRGTESTVPSAIVHIER